MIKYSDIKEDLGLDKLKYFENDEAVITHYLQNINEPTQHLYKPITKKYFQVKEKYFQERLPIKWDVPFPPPTNPKFKFIDLFAGIGGFRIAFQELGGQCVFSSEIDPFAKKTYEKNFGEVPFGDITKIVEKDIPDFDILLAGFPCQPFSLAGVSKKNSLGREHGFKDKTQGTLFFDIKKILKEKKPTAFFLENVKNLLTHDNHKTFEVIRETLEDDLGYVINWKIIDGAKWVPQHRERIFIVGYNPKKIKISKQEIIIPSKPRSNFKYKTLPEILGDEVDSKYTVGPGTWDTLKRHKEHHAKMGNGFGYGLIDYPPDSETMTRTISARYHKDGAEVLIKQKNNRPRKLTVEEALQLQGYDPRKFIMPVSDTQAYRQIGNSVVVPAIKETAKEIIKIIK